MTDERTGLPPSAAFDAAERRRLLDAHREAMLAGDRMTTAQ